jgi:hypothetical protein
MQGANAVLFRQLLKTLAFPYHCRAIRLTMHEHARRKQRKG